MHGRLLQNQKECNNRTITSLWVARCSVNRVWGNLVWKSSLFTSLVVTTLAALGSRNTEGVVSRVDRTANSVPNVRRSFRERGNDRKIQHREQPLIEVSHIIKMKTTLLQTGKVYLQIGGNLLGTKNGQCLCVQWEGNSIAEPVKWFRNAETWIRNINHPKSRPCTHGTPSNTSMTSKLYWKAPRPIHLNVAKDSLRFNRWRYKNTYPDAFNCHSKDKANRRAAYGTRIVRSCGRQRMELFVDSLATPWI